METPLWSEAERQVFHHKDANGKDRYLDPSGVTRRLVSALKDTDTANLYRNATLPNPPKLDENLQQVKDADGELVFEPLSLPQEALRDDAINTLLKACCTAFKVELLNEETGEGYTEAKVMGIYFDWCEFLQSLKKTTESSQKTLTPTEDTLPASSTAENLPT